MQNETFSVIFKHRGSRAERKQYATLLSQTVEAEKPEEMLSREAEGFLNERETQKSHPKNDHKNCNKGKLEAFATSSIRKLNTPWCNLLHLLFFPIDRVLHKSNRRVPQTRNCNCEVQFGKIQFHLISFLSVDTLRQTNNFCILETISISNFRLKMASMASAASMASNGLKWPQWPQMASIGLNGLKRPQ